MSRGKWLNPGPSGAPAARVLQRVRVPHPGPGASYVHRTRVIVTCNGLITEDTLACVSRLVRAGLV